MIKRFLFFVLLVIISFSSFSQTRYYDRVFEEIEVQEGIWYGAADPFISVPFFQDNLYYDFYQPVGDDLELRPLVITIFGGAFVAGGNQWEDVVAWSDSLTHRGYTCAAIDYRLVEDNPCKALVENEAFRVMYRATQDVRAFVRHIKENYEEFGVDTTHIYVIGNSAGSINALNAIYLDDGEEPDYIHDYALHEDLGCLDCSTNDITGHTVEFKAAIPLWGAIHNLEWITQEETTPILMIHGTDDTTVPFDSGMVYEGDESLLVPNIYMEGSNAIDEKLDSLNIEHEFIPFEGRPHVFYAAGALANEMNFEWPTIMKLGIDFLAMNNDYFEGSLSSDNDVIGLSFQGIECSLPIIDNNQHIVTIYVPLGTDVSTLSPQFELSYGAVGIYNLNLASLTEDELEIESVDFSSPVDYKVISEDLNIEYWSIVVEVEELNDENDILEYVLCSDLDHEVNINHDNHSIVITSSQLDIQTSYSADYVLSDQATIYIDEEYQHVCVNENNFLNTIVYTVVSGNGQEQEWQVDLDVLSGVNSLNINPFKIFPNPASDYLTIDLIETKNASFEMFDISGREVITKNIDQHNCIDISELPSGLYFISIEIEKHLFHEKIIVK